MHEDILTTLEERVAKAVGLIQTLQQQINGLMQENHRLKNEQDVWRKELLALIQKLDKIDIRQHEHTALDLFSTEQFAEEALV